MLSSTSASTNTNASNASASTSALIYNTYVYYSFNQQYISVYY